MRKVFFVIFIVAAFVLAVLLAWPLDMTFAGEAPPITPAEFGSAAAAHPIWSILAGQGFLGAVFVGLGGLAYKLLRPYIVAYMKGKNIDRLYLAVEAFVAQVNAEYTEGMKKANADGKLTKDEAAFVFSLCKQNLVIFMQSQGVDIIKEYGDAFVGALIEYVVSQLKNPVAKAVALPLSGSSGSAPLPESVTGGALPG